MQTSSDKGGGSEAKGNTLVFGLHNNGVETRVISADPGGATFCNILKSHSFEQAQGWRITCLKNLIERHH